MQNYYEILELHMEADVTEIETRIKEEYSKWRKRVNAPDPKKQREANERMELLGEAEQILLNPEKRAEYDQSLFSEDEEQFQTQFYEPETDEQQFYDDPDEEFDFSAAQVDIARSFIQSEQYADAIYAAQKAVDSNGQNPYAWATLAEAHFYWNEPQAADYEINEAIRLLPTDAFFYLLAFHIAQNLNQQNRAAEMIHKAIKVDPHNAAFIEAAAEFERLRGQFLTGIQIIEHYEKTQTLNNSLKNQLGLLYCTKGLHYSHNPKQNNGKSSLMYIEKSEAETAINDFTTAANYAVNPELRTNISKYKTYAENALEYKLRYKILAWYIVLIPIFYTSLTDFNLMFMAISGGLGYLVWKKGRVQNYILNKKSLTA